MKVLKEMAVKKPCSFIFILTFLVFAVLQYKPAVLNYTTRFVDFAQYMLAHGVTLFPIADDLRPYPDYTVINTAPCLSGFFAVWSCIDSFNGPSFLCCRGLDAGVCLQARCIA